MRDICDGSYVRDNYGAEYSNRKLQLAFYCDEVEVVNQVNTPKNSYIQL